MTDRWAAAHSKKIRWLPVAFSLLATVLPQSASAAIPSTYVPILMYHYIRVNPLPQDQAGFALSVTPTAFRSQMRYLAANHFNVISLGRAVDAIRQHQALPYRPVVLTFDDGYADFYSTAIPELRRWGYTATDYVIPGFVGHPSFMNWSEVVRADALGFTIGAHTMHHVPLASVSAASALSEMSQSKVVLQGMLRHPVSEFAYPFGSFNGYLANQARGMGFESATTTVPGAWHQPGDLWRLSRQRVGGYTALSDFARQVGGPPVASGGGLPPPPEPAAVLGPGGAYHPLDPVRILDTRNGLGGRSTPLSGGQSLELQVAGSGGVPASGAVAAVLNVTATNTSNAGHLTVFPSQMPMPVVSNLNWTAGVTIPNLVEVKLGASGQVTIAAAGGTVDVVADVEGWVGSPMRVPGPDGLYNPVQPARLLDTRDGTGGFASPVGSGQSISLQVGGRSGVPAGGAEAVVLNVTVTEPSQSGYVTVWPEGSPLPVASNLNFVRGQTVPNRVIVRLGQSGKINLYNGGGTVHLVADLNGWFTDGSPGQGGTGFVSVAPYRILDTRYGIGGNAWPLFDQDTMAVQVAGHGGVPGMNASTPPKAVVLNVTATNTSVASFMTAWPEGAPRSPTSDLNWDASLTVPNLVVVEVGPSGKVNLYNLRGLTDVVVDVAGYYS